MICIIRTTYYAFTTVKFFIKITHGTKVLIKAFFKHINSKIIIYIFEL